MDDKTLARRVLADRERQARRDRHTPWYMVNVNHPAISALYEEWRREEGEVRGAPGDEARVIFELSILTPRARQLLEQHYETIDMIREAMGRDDFKLPAEP